jgi:hypothetical protein
MATTKVIPEVIDLNQASSTTGLRMPKGSSAYAAPPTVAEGMMRNEVGQVSSGSASCMQHFNDTEWKNYDNLILSVSVSFLVVAGGGGGNISNGGGGGAGGLRTSYATTGGGGSAEAVLSLSTLTDIAVTVGPGASLSVSPTHQNGQDSIFSSITSTGGGSGGFRDPNVSASQGQDGGSGGGGPSQGSPANSSPNGNAVTSPVVQGFDGTFGVDGPGNGYLGGGGGGSGGVGAVYGNGGAGLPVNILSSTNAGPSFANVGEVVGSDVYYGGGGGGGANSGPGTGGLGGGGDGSSTLALGSGTANTGGGGGSGSSSSIVSGGTGGSGVVIIRYPSANAITVPGTLIESTGSPFTEGSFKVSVFISGSGNIQIT